MPEQPLIDTAEARKKLNSYVNQLESRAEALMRVVTSEAAKEFKKFLVSKAPEDLANMYEDFLKLVRVGGKNKGSFALMYMGPSTGITTKDPKKTVYYVKTKFAKEFSKDDPRYRILMVLGKYSPFALDYLPAKIPKGRFYVVARQVSEREVNLVRDRNEKQRPKLQRDIEKHKLKLKLKKLSQKQLAKMDVYDDFLFEVMRREFGLGVAKTPHWRPAVRYIKSGVLIEQVLTSESVRRIILDPDYAGWKRLGRLKQNVSESNTAFMEEFMERVL